MEWYVEDNTLLLNREDERQTVYDEDGEEQHSERQQPGNETF
jgi:hypothetical protein